jgi:hypothetical protein
VGVGYGCSIYLRNILKIVGVIFYIPVLSKNHQVVVYEAGRGYND